MMAAINAYGIPLAALSTNTRDALIGGAGLVYVIVNTIVAGYGSGRD